MADEIEERLDRLIRIHEHAKQALRNIGLDPDQRADDGSMPPTVGEHIEALGADNAALRQRVAELEAEHRRERESICEAAADGAIGYYSEWWSEGMERNTGGFFRAGLVAAIREALRGGEADGG
jgi:hypothetical protein